jgi:Ca-activated chloride channel family protein
MDASQSMLKNDVAPSRDARAHLLVDGLLGQGVNRPVAIIAAAGSAHVLLPPAQDPAIVKLYLGYLSPDVMPLDGGDLSYLARVLADTPGLLVHGTTVLLVTDGMSTGAGELAALLAKHNIPVATLAFTALGQQTGKKLGGPVISGDKLTPNNTQLLTTLNALSARATGTGTRWVDEYRWFVLPVALFLLFWFRRGVTLYWGPAMLAGILLAAPNSSQADVVDWFFTPDQQGMLLLKMGKYKEAASRFDDPGWKGVACYYAEDWQCARQQFAKIPSQAGVYNMATAAAQGGAYKLARDIYAQLLKINPDFPHAQSNYEQMAALVKEIDDFSESQQSEKPPDPDANQQDNQQAGERADGAKENAYGQRPAQQLSAEEVLKSKAMTDRWLRDISRDPKAFVRARFQYEYAREQADDS